LEITLRNAIYEAAKEYFKRDDWFDDTAVIHYQYNQTAIRKAKQALERQNKPTRTRTHHCRANLWFLDEFIRPSL